MLSSSAYDGYGNEASAGSPTDPFGYHAQDGYYLDRETGLYYCQARYYDPGTGRWLTRDPIGYGGGIDLYGYCGSGPMGASDRSGHGGGGAEGPPETSGENGGAFFDPKDPDDDGSNFPWEDPDYKPDSDSEAEPVDPPMPEPDMGPYDPEAGLTTSTKLAEDCAFESDDRVVPRDEDGNPDFDDYAVEDVTIEPTGSRRGDRRAANRAIGKPGRKTSDDGLIWHHHAKDRGRMQLIPEEIHGAAGNHHTGGYHNWGQP